MVKIITDTAVYVQKIDLEFFKYRLHSLPPSISSKIFEKSNLNIDDYDKYDFLKFEDKDDIEFFKSIDWIIDYDSIRNLTSKEIAEMGRTYVDELEKITRKLYRMTPKDENYNGTLLQSTLLNYQIASLNDIVDFKLGLLKISIPEEGNRIQKIMRKLLSRLAK